VEAKRIANQIELAIFTRNEPGRTTLIVELLATVIAFVESGKVASGHSMVDDALYQFFGSTSIRTGTSPAVRRTRSFPTTSKRKTPRQRRSHIFAEACLPSSHGIHPTTPRSSTSC
jgi:hypothetical protein